MFDDGTMQGYSPGIYISQGMRPTEKELYEQAWNLDEYRKIAPGEHCVSQFLQVAKPAKGSRVIDFGCGTGRGSLMLSLLGGLNIDMVDFASNCLDKEIQDILPAQSQGLRFTQHDLTTPLNLKAEYGFCTDVMEHIPTPLVHTVLGNILKSSQKVFFQISTVEDYFGSVLGHPLHLTIKPIKWWIDELKKHDAEILWARVDDGSCMIYCTAWVSGKDIVEAGSLNTDIEDIKSNIVSCLTRALPEAAAFDLQENVELMLLGGGPSLAQFEQEIIEKRKNGMPLVTTNGAYNWAIERGLNPSAQILVDPRELNKKFVTPVVTDCKYLLSSQCHPAVFDAVPSNQTIVWHGVLSDEIGELIAKYRQEWYAVPGGSTVMLRAIPLLRMLGFKNFHVYGLDSCVFGDIHHAYSQTENDGENLATVNCGGKLFNCTGWMVSQAHEFMDLVKMMGDEVNMIVYGDGLISEILKTGASLEVSKN